MAGCEMSCDFLLSVRKLLSWLLAFLMALLPQHLIVQLTGMDLFRDATYAVVTTASGKGDSSDAAYGSQQKDKRIVNEPGPSSTQPRQTR
jgi:hypothetical protein